MRGFTLIELLVVVAVLSAAAMLAFGVTAEDRMQIRYDDTRNRMQSLYRALLGGLEPAAGTGGYVADNGGLPAGASALLAAGSLAPRAAQTPLFDPDPDGTCAGNGGETALPAAAALLKGHRGNYLGGLAYNGSFRDGWGNIDADAALDALNFGWIWNTGVANALTLASLGADNAAGGSAMAADRALTVAPGDWRIPLAGLNVRIANRTGAPIPADSYAVSLLAFRNNGTGGSYWLRHSSDANAAAIADGDSVALPFGGRCYPGGTAAMHGAVPQGRHVLVLTRKAGGWGGSEALHPSAADAVFTHIDLIGGLIPPLVELSIR
ncbi:MAG: prepilin-type N-terminal cleavage/methylation domain-containing protein [Sulfuricella sp.]|nr:prepilin-type N-terminal cleavage/methylation domain-containing protein [Sulfuricella sp.]